MAVERNTDAELGIIKSRLEAKAHTIRKWYFLGFCSVVASALVLVSVGAAFNTAGYAIVNFVFAAAFLIVWAYFTHHPWGILGAATVGVADGLPKDWSINRLKELLSEGGKPFPDLSLSNIADEAWKWIGRYVRMSAQLAYFVTVVFVVMGTFHIKNPYAILPIFIVLAGLLMWLVFKGSPLKWYPRITSLILFVSLSVFVYKAFVGEPQHDEPTGGVVIPSPQAIASGVTNVLNGFTSARWVVVDEFDCELGLKSWQQSQGVCQSVAVDKDGRYRLAIKSHKMTLARERDKTGGGGIEQLVLRPEGIFLAYWSGNPDAVRELRRQAPFNEHVGAIIARAGQAGRWALAFSQEVRAPEFELKKGQVIQASLNLPPRKDWFDDNTGHYSLEIERLE